MESSREHPTSEKRVTGRPLFWWPFTLFALTIAMLVVAGRVSAWRGPDGEPGMRWRAHAERMLDRVLSKLDASDDQATRIHAIADETFEILAASHADRRGDADALRALITADPPDRAALEALRSEHLARADALSEAVVEKLARVLEVLTPEQRQKLVEQLDEHRAHFRRHPHGHHSDHHPDEHGPDASRDGDGA